MFISFTFTIIWSILFATELYYYLKDIVFIGLNLWSILVQASLMSKTIRKTISKLFILVTF